VAPVRLGHHHAVPTGEPSRTADVEEALDLFVNAADGLDLTALVHRPRHCDRLRNGDPAETRQEAIEALHRGGLAGCRRAQSEQVVAVMPDADAEDGRAESALLPDHDVERRQLLGRTEWQAGWIAVRPQLIGLQLAHGRTADAIPMPKR
jgi:hypothetical protein